MASIPCKWCGDLLDVGNEERSIVAVCMNGHMMHNREGKPIGRSIAQCDTKQWGSPSTRFNHGDPADPGHVIQTDPPRTLEAV